MVAEYIKQFFFDNNQDWDNLVIFGIRNDANPEMDMFNDVLGFICDDELHLAKGTTDPGVYYTQNPLNKDGAFHFNLGWQEKIWRLRKHRNKYLALCDDWKTNKISGWRDKNKNHINDDGIEVFDNVGGNLHLASNDDLILYSSAGCQVTPDKKFFNKLINCAKDSGQDLFSYMLFSIDWIPTNIIVEIMNTLNVR